MNLTSRFMRFVLWSLRSNLRRPGSRGTRAARTGPPASSSRLSSSPHSHLDSCRIEFEAPQVAAGHAAAAAASRSSYPRSPLFFPRLARGLFFCRLDYFSLSFCFPSSSCCLLVASSSLPLFASFTLYRPSPLLFPSTSSPPSYYPRLLAIIIPQHVLASFTLYPRLLAIIIPQHVLASFTLYPRLLLLVSLFRPRLLVSSPLFFPRLSRPLFSRLLLLVSSSSSSSSSSPPYLVSSPPSPRLFCFALVSSPRLLPRLPLLRATSSSTHRRSSLTILHFQKKIIYTRVYRLL